MAKITNLIMNFGNNGEMITEIWATCYTKEDCEQMISWLQLAKSTGAVWKRIHEKAQNAKSTASKQHEVAKSR